MGFTWMGDYWDGGEGGGVESQTFWNNACYGWIYIHLTVWFWVSYPKSRHGLIILLINGGREYQMSCMTYWVGDLGLFQAKLGRWSTQPSVWFSVYYSKSGHAWIQGESYHLTKGRRCRVSYMACRVWLSPSPQSQALVVIYLCERLIFIVIVSLAKDWRRTLYLLIQDNLNIFCCIHGRGDLRPFGIAVQSCYCSRLQLGFEL